MSANAVRAVGSAVVALPAFGLDGDAGERVGEDVVHLMVDAHAFLQDGQSRTHVAVMFGHDPAFLPQP